MDPYNNSNYNQQAAYDVNPYYKPYQGPAFTMPGSSSSHSAPVPANAYEYDVGIVAQQSVYVPGAMIDKRGGSGGKLAKGGKRLTVLRKGAGKVWEDQTLLEWNSCQYYYCNVFFSAPDVIRLQLGSDFLLVILAMTCLTIFLPTLLTYIPPLRRQGLFGIG